jgi:hypothetical protein
VEKNNGTDAVSRPSGRHPHRVKPVIYQRELEMELWDAVIDECDGSKDNALDNKIRALEDALNEPLDPME